MPQRLFDRQSRLLEYLTSDAAIFGGEDDGPLDPSLRGIDRTMLRLEARFSCEKRIEKIAGTLPKTFAALGESRSTIIREFVAACPPVDIGRLENAVQFHDFLVSRARDATGPPYLPDIVRCELACAERGSAVPALPSKSRNRRNKARRGHVRRKPDMTLLRCDHDVRPVFEAAAPIVPKQRRTLLAVTIEATSKAPRVCEIPPAVFDLLSALDDWTDLRVDCTSETDGLVSELLAQGLIEVAG